jgi:hypothetical protein
VNEVDSIGWTPLMFAAYMWDARMYQRGAKDEESSNQPQWRQGDWESFAAKHDPVVIVKALVEAGALRREGRADALEIAGQRSDEQKAQLLAILRKVKVKGQD